MTSKDNLVPKHIAVIMDGNGRWATSKGLSRAEGHAKGVETLREILKLCKEFNIDYLTAYAFSTENWKRPKEEVDALMGLLVEYLKVEVEKLKEEGISLRVIGDMSRMPELVRNELKSAVDELAKYNNKRVLTLALNYGGRDEILRATKSIAQKVANGYLDISSIDENLFESFLDTAGTPDPDLLIRTAGELRLSNFLLWQLSYTELYATDTCWPDFSRDDFLAALKNFEQRTRKFGTIDTE